MEMDGVALFLNNSAIKLLKNIVDEAEFIQTPNAKLEAAAKSIDYSAKSILVDYVQHVADAGESISNLINDPDVPEWVRDAVIQQSKVIAEMVFRLRVIADKQKPEETI